MSPSSIWDDSLSNYYCHGLKVYWETLDRVASYQARCMTGRNGLDPFDHVVRLIQRHLGNDGNLCALALGCGEERSYEMRFMETGLFSRIDVLDLAAPLLERQRLLASAAGIEGLHYHCRDLDRAALPAASYDFIWAVGTLHHIERLEHLFGQIRHSMKARALLVVREYVGPNRLQFTARQLALVNAILKVLPARLKKTATGETKESESHPAEDALPDPSEAVRSRDILPLLRAHFPNLRVSATGGTILYPLLQRIAFNFEIDPIGPPVLKLLMWLETALIKTGLLPSDFVFCVAARPMSDRRANRAC